MRISDWSSDVCSSDLIERTTSVVDLGELFNRLGPIVGAIDPAQVNEFLDTITAALEGREDDIGATLDDLATLVGGLASRDDAIQRLITNIDLDDETVNRRDAQIETMLTNHITPNGRAARKEQRREYM